MAKDPLEIPVQSFDRVLSRTSGVFYGGSPTPTPSRSLNSTFATLELATRPYEVQRNVLGIFLAGQFAPLVGTEAAQFLKELLTTADEGTLQGRFVKSAVKFRIEQELGATIRD